MLCPANDRQQQGFTLLEVLVVVFIVGVMATMFTLAVGVAGGVDRELRQETERLETLVRLAQEDATVQAHELGLRFYPQRYEFSFWSRGQIADPTDDSWMQIQDEVFAPRKLHKSFEFELEIEGRNVVLDNSAKEVEKNYKPQIFIFSSGDISDAFVVRIRDRVERRGYTLEVATDGTTEIRRDEP
ncbi:MAG: type II secretion system minor pseudopilin GspH [Gammaproteobacteria bacterium]